MNALMVGDDLNKSGQDYDDLIDAIKAKGIWWHHLDSTWLVKTAKTPVELRDELRKHIDSNDELFVVDVTGRAAAWFGFNDKGSAWLRENL